MGGSVSRVRGAAGISLVEMLVVIAVITIFAGAAIPAYNRHAEVARLKSAAEGLYITKRNAKSEAVMRNQAMTVVLGDVSGETWCIGVTDAADCHCFQANSCEVAGVSRVISGADFPGVRLTFSSASRRYIFKPTYGAMAAGSATFTAPSGLQLRVVTSRLGRVRLCSPSGAGNLSGYAVC